MNKTLSEIYRGMPVLVTGHTGFKGSWLSIWLRELGAKVVGYSIDPPTQPNNFDLCGLGGKMVDLRGDVRDYDRMEQMIRKYSPRIVFHLAAQPIVLISYEQPKETLDTNVGGTINVLEALRKTRTTGAFVGVTSDKCYENRDWVYGYRETDPLGGYDPYSASKGAAEIIISSYIRSFFSKDGTPVISSARAGNVIGGGDWSKNRIIPDFMRSLEGKKPIDLRNPKAVRPWQHVLEPLYGYLLLGATMITKGHSFSGAWNFGPLYRNNLMVEDLIRRFIEHLCA